MDINQLLWGLAGALGLAPGNLAIILGLVVFAANTTSRLIPDTATGTLGTIRLVASWIGLHVRNNTGTAPIATGTEDVVIPTAPAKSVGEPAATITDLVDTAELTDPKPPVKDPFGAAARLGQNPLIAIGAFLALMPILMTLQACATTDDTHLANDVCTHQIVLTQGANAAIQNANLITDPKAHDAAIAAAEATLALVAACPGSTQSKVQ